MNALIALLTIIALVTLPVVVAAKSTGLTIFIAIVLLVVIYVMLKDLLD